MPSLDLQNLSHSIGILGLAVIALILTYKKIFKDWKSTDAETSVIELMHTELERMSKQNTLLSSEIGRLHSEIITLSNQLQKLTVENQQLQLEVVALTTEVGRLQVVLHKGDLNAAN